MAINTDWPDTAKNETNDQPEDITRTKYRDPLLDVEDHFAALGESKSGLSSALDGLESEPTSHYTDLPTDATAPADTDPDIDPLSDIDDSEYRQFDSSYSSSEPAQDSLAQKTYTVKNKTVEAPEEAERAPDLIAVLTANLELKERNLSPAQKLMQEAQQAKAVIDRQLRKDFKTYGIKPYKLAYDKLPEAFRQKMAGVVEGNPISNADIVRNVLGVPEHKVQTVLQRSSSFMKGRCRSAVQDLTAVPTGKWMQTRNMLSDINCTGNLGNALASLASHTRTAVVIKTEIDDLRFQLDAERTERRAETLALRKDVAELQNSRKPDAVVAPLGRADRKEYAREQYAAGVPAAAIAKQLGVNRSTVTRWL